MLPPAPADTEGSFTVDRLTQMAQAAVLHMQQMAARQKSDTLTQSVSQSMLAFA